MIDYSSTKSLLIVCSLHTHCKNVNMIFMKRYKKKFVVSIFAISIVYSIRSSFVTNPEMEDIKRNKNLLHLTRPSIDMVNDYYPFVDFKFISPEISPKVNTKSNIFMIILVNSGAKGANFRERRETIRQTWGSRSNCEHRKALKDERLKDLRWLLVFVVGKAGPGTNDDELNMVEAKIHNDMLVGNITDNYVNNVIKFYMGQIWASRLHVKYTMKTDDDVYVRIPRVLEYLANAKFPSPFYGGLTRQPSKVTRTVGQKWTISYKYYEETYFPSFNPGAFFILSTDLLDILFNYVNIRKPFHVDDEYVGLAMRDYKISTTNIDSFHLSGSMSSYILDEHLEECEMLSWSAFGHSMDPRVIKELHRRLQSHVCKSITLDINHHRCNVIAIVYHWLKSQLMFSRRKDTPSERT